MATPIKITFELSGNVVGQTSQFTNAFNGLQVTINNFNNKVAASAAKAGNSAKTLNKNLAANYGSTRAGLFSFRSDIDGFNNSILNSIALTIRALARIRTAVFILVTVFAVRPVIRLFNSLIEASTLAKQQLEDFKNISDLKFGKLGEMLSPLRLAFEGLKNVAIDKFIEFITASGPAIGSMVRGIGDIAAGLNFVVLTIKPIAELLRPIVDLVEILALALSRGFAYATLGIQKFLYALGGIDIQEKAGIAGLFLLGPLQAIGDAFGGANLHDAIKKTEADIKSLDTAFEDWGKRVEKSYPSVTSAVIDLVSGVGKGLAAIPAATTAVLSRRTGIQAVAEDAATVIEKNLDKVKLNYTKTKKYQEDWNKVWTDGSWVAKASLGFDLFAKGVVESTKSVTETIKRLGGEVADAFKNSMSDTFFTIMEGKFNKFRDIVIGFLNGVKRAIANFMAEQVTRELLGKVLGIVGSGLTSLFVGTPTATTAAPTTTKKQHGGVVTGSSLVPAGEAGPEAFVPLHGNKIPVRIEGGGMGKPVVVNFNVTAVDSRSVAGFFQQNKAQIRQIMISAAAGDDMAVRRAFKLV